MKYSATQYAKALRELANEAPLSQRRVVIRDFLSSLMKNNALSLIPDIVREYEKVLDTSKGVKSVLVNSPERVSEGAFSRKLHFKARIDARRDSRLVGGVVIEVGDTRADNSIAMRIKRLKEALCA